MAWYRKGTISVTNGGKTVVGDNTNWISQHQGWILVTEQSGDMYEIGGIVSSTEITLKTDFTGASATGLNYFIIPTHSLNADLVAKLNSVIELFNTTKASWDSVVADFSMSSYEFWKTIPGNESGTPAQFIEAIKGAPGDTGQSAYQIWIGQGNTGSENDFLDALSQGSVTASATNAANAATAQTGSEAARDLAQKWASEIEDTEVANGLFSALHHAAKAALSAAEASSQLVLVQNEGNTQVSAVQSAGTAKVSDIENAAATQIASMNAVRAQVEAIFDNFDDRYVGSFTTEDEPNTDNDGDPLIIGAIYHNQTEDELMFWNGSVWKSPQATAEAAAAAALQSQQAAEAARDAAISARDAAALSASQSAQNVLDSATHANNASLASNSTAWVSGGTYVLNQLVWSLINQEGFHCIVPHTGETTDPLNDPIHWAPNESSSHNHEISSVTGLQDALDAKAGTYHSHVIGDISGLQSALDAKATSAQGAKADTAVQPNQLSTVATSNDYNDLDNKPSSDGMSPIVAAIIFGG